MSRRLPALLAVLAVAAALVGCSSSYKAGDQASREWEAWVEDHPITGARVTDSVSRNVQPFRGTFEAYARLTATPSEKAIVKAMASMCRFDDETSSRTTYWLQIDRVSLQAPCQKEEQEKVAGFWTDVEALPGLEEVAFSTKGVALSGEDAAITALAAVVSDAADATDHATAKSVNDYTSPHVSITQGKGVDLSDELKLAQGVLNVAGTDVKAIRVVRDRVSASTSGSVEQARGWQRQVGLRSPVLTVTPDKVTTEVRLKPAARDLVERLSTTPGVLAVATLKPFWTIDVATTDDARSVIADLANEPGVKNLNTLTVGVGTEQYQSATGKGRTCFVRPAFPETEGRANALLDLCDVPNAVDVDDRFDVSLSLRLKGEDPDHAGLPQALACLKRMPLGQPVYLLLPQNNTVEFTTAEHLRMEFPDAARSKQLERLWETLPAS